MAFDVLLIPLVVALACALPIGGLARPLAVSGGLLTAASVALATWFGVGRGSVQAYVWAAPLGAQLSLGGDGWSAAFLVLTGVSFAAGAAASGGVRSPRAYFALWSLLQAVVSGVLVARDLILFFACWEALLAPLALLMWHWGGADRRSVTQRLVVYWMAGSALLLTGIVALGVGARTFAFADLSGYRLAEGSQIILALLFLTAFATRLPLFPFNAWLPRAYVAAPLPVALVLSSVISKTAVYAIVRICVPFFPRGMADLAPYAIAIATVGTLHGALLATRQRDTRAVVAYASLSQLSVIALGAFLTTPGAFEGALIASVSHGLVVTALFLLAASVARRVGSFDFGAGGLASRAPVLTSLCVVAILASIGMPGTSGAPGELLILAAAFGRSPGIGLLAALAIVVSAVCGAGLLRGIFFGPSTGGGTDIGWRERALVVPLLVLVVVLGVAPRLVGDLAERSGDAPVSAR
ncbi:MAG TPA: NADH-quinone oxidoreductase subunit M [Candidatus Limnocylindria bacterium]|nr:NADH-quinone oxidoreductase subunit M [Candidatus Limnocylindria bacterium]